MGLPISKSKVGDTVLLKLHGEKCDGFLEANHFFKFFDFGYHFLKTFSEQGLNACMIFGYKYQAIYSFECIPI